MAGVTIVAGGGSGVVAGVVAGVSVATALGRRVVVRVRIVHQRLSVTSRSFHSE
jgi:hypothetical protein